MVIFLNLDGTANVVVPERMFQGSTLNSITVISAYPSTTAMQIAFFLPSGTATSYAPMHFNLASSVERAGVWSYALPFAVLQNVGVVGVAIMATLLSGNQTSYTCDFKVEESVLPTPPPQPTADIYQLILQYLAQDQSSIVNLDIRVGDLENVIVKRTMIDFTAVSDGTMATFTKHYSDNTTAVFSMPISGGAPVTASGLVIVTFSASSWRDTGTMLAPSGVFELAFANTQTMQRNANFLVDIAKEDSYIYEVGSEVTPILKKGFSKLADKIFKGSDGSVLLTGVRTPYSGQLVCFDGKINGEVVGTNSIFDNAVTFPKLSQDIQQQLNNGGKAGITLNFLQNQWQQQPEDGYSLVIPKVAYEAASTGQFLQFSNNIVFGITRLEVGISLHSSIAVDFTVFIK